MAPDPPVLDERRRPMTIITDKPEHFSQSLGIFPHEVQAGEGLEGETYAPNGDILIKSRKHGREVVKKLGYEQP